VYAGGEPGSPRLALETMLDHRHFKNMTGGEFVLLFNEMDPARYESLKKVVADLEAERRGWPSNVHVIVENMNFVDLADEMIASLSGEQMAPIFAFVDPFGYREVPLEKIRAITQVRQGRTVHLCRLQQRQPVQHVRQGGPGVPGPLRHRRILLSCTLSTNSLTVHLHLSKLLADVKSISDLLVTPASESRCDPHRE
jgi:hypothetical protein